MNALLERFLRYIKIDTQSDAASKTTPSTAKQFELARMLADELRDMGLTDVSLDNRCYVMATLPSNTRHKAPVVGFVSHIDTSPDMTTVGMNPQIVSNYDGGDIVLNRQNNVVLSPSEFPELLLYKGQTLVTTDGTTLLSADDKAGVAEIMTAVDYLIQHPEIEHGTIKICFTPDEEIGRGADHFDVQKFGADFAYTMDGGQIGELEYENFNAAYAAVTIAGRNVHPGTAKNKMRNASQIAMEFNSLLPVSERPEYTEGYEGFFHLIHLKGEVENASLQYIVRDHDRRLFENRKEMLLKVTDFLNHKYGAGTVTIELRDQYYNMREKVEPVKYIVDIAEQAMKNVGVQPIIKPIRGGTDGARLSFMGLPTPNIFAGGHNFHGKYEFVPVESMQKAVDVIVEIAKLVVKNTNSNHA